MLAWHISLNIMEVPPIYINPEQTPDINNVRLRHWKVNFQFQIHKVLHFVIRLSQIHQHKLHRNLNMSFSMLVIFLWPKTKSNHPYDRNIDIKKVKSSFLFLLPYCMFFMHYDRLYPKICKHHHVIIDFESFVFICYWLIKHFGQV